MRVIILLVIMACAVGGQKCRVFIDLRIKWTVDCSAMNLTSPPPPMIIHPIVVLNMSHNVIVHLNESQFYNWTDISHLDLSYNRIRQINGNSLEGLKNLIELNLMNNYIEVLSSNITKHLPKLRILNLSSNKLKTIEMKTFDPIPLLLKLYLGHNLDLGKNIENFGNLNTSLSQGLISLNIENISLSELPNNFFNQSNHLIALNIALNPLKIIPALPLGLRALNISGTLIETIPQELFLQSELIQKLSLENMLLTEIKANTFSGLSNLEELYIKNCPKLTSISENIFGETSPKLRRVVISHCALSTLPKTFEPLFSKVEYLDLQNNPWTCDGRLSWIVDTKILPNLTDDFRCENPPPSKGMLVVDYFRPRSLHPHYSLIRAGIVIAMVIVLVASVVGMVKHTSKQKAKVYRQLHDIRLQDRTPNGLPPL